MELSLPFHTHYVRKLGATDAAAFRDHLLRLDSEGRRNRFNGLTDESFIERYAARSFGPQTTVFGWFEDGVLRGAAELHRPADGTDEPAEAAFSVEQPFQCNGVGTALLRRLLHYARNRAVGRVQIITTPQNQAMQALARKFGATMDYVYGDTVGTIDAGQPSAMSMMLEAFEDAQGFVSSILTAPQAAINKAKAHDDAEAATGRNSRAA
ncbi:MAG: GNAT family N-acetyltransferase [Beijerinckiaceae bacterium]